MKPIIVGIHEIYFVYLFIFFRMLMTSSPPTQHE